MADDGGAARPRVLVVEDEAIVAMHLERVLERAGWEVVGPAAHQLAALRLAWREPLDAALLDLDLRGESGAPVAEALLARGVPVVVLSGSRRGSPDGALSGVTRLQKPYRPEVVLRALAAAVLARAA
jgi:DNA-binding response OmpR family regulator